MQSISDRRSIRKYKPEDVPAEAIKEILKAGILAPSSKNRQPWKFIVVIGASKESMLSVTGKLYAAMAVGYADEEPHARPRNNLEDVVEWRD